MKEYKEKTQEEALHRAKSLNKKFKTLKNNQTWGYTLGDKNSLLNWFRALRLQ